MTEAGKAWWSELDRGADQLLAQDPRWEWVVEAWGRDSATRDRILAIEAEAREQGARQERERLRKEADTLVEMHTGCWAKVEWLLADPVLSDPQPEDPGDGGERS
jgi:hypothetical protein